MTREQWGIPAEEFDHALAIAEIKRLRSQLAAFTEGMPERRLFLVAASSLFINEESMVMIKWLRRIASMGDK